MSMSKQIQRVGDANNGGGVIQSTPQSTVYANGRLVAVTGSRGSPHPKKHDSWSTGFGSGSVRIDCYGINLTGDRDSCGHIRIGGSDDIYIGESGDREMACQSSDVTYVTPEGVTTMYTPAAQRQMGSEGPGQVSASDPPEATMQDKTEPPEVEPGPPVSCGEFNQDTPDSVQLSTNYRLSDVTLKTTFPHKVVAARGLSRPDIICNLKQMCESIAEPVRAKVLALGHPRLTITSSFRPGEARSHHGVGAAFDMQVLSMKPQEMFELAQWISSSLPVDQIILEGVGARNHWIHASMALRGANSVGAGARILTQTSSGGYAKGLFLLNYGRV